MNIVLICGVQYKSLFLFSIVFSSLNSLPFSYRLFCSFFCICSLMLCTWYKHIVAGNHLFFIFSNTKTKKVTIRLFHLRVSLIFPKKLVFSNRGFKSNSLFKNTNYIGVLYTLLYLLLIDKILWIIHPHTVWMGRKQKQHMRLFFSLLYRGI